MRFNLEADSLNFSMLGPDAAPGTEEFDLFVKEVAREMTVKAGQKCTAIRRTFVPEAMVEDVMTRADEAARRREGRRSGGRGRAHGTARRPRPGAATCASNADAHRAASRSCVYGDPDEFDVVGADREKGAFFPALLFYSNDPFARTRAARRRGVRSGEHGDAVRHGRRGDRARASSGRGASSARCSRPTTTWRARWCSAPRRTTAGSCS